MQLISSLIVLGSLATTSLAAVSCPSPTPCKGLPAVAASALKGYPPAESLCSKKFPLARRTCTSTALPVTATLTVATSTITTTVATATASAGDHINTHDHYYPYYDINVDRYADCKLSPKIQPTLEHQLTKTHQDTLSVTTIVTVTANARRKRSQPTARAVDPRVSKLSSLTSQASSFVGAVCTCLETPASITATTTPTSTNRVTATVTSSVTASTTITITPTSTVTATVTANPIIITATVTTTSTTTATITSTTTVAPARATCTKEASDFSLGSNFCSSNGQSCNYVPSTCFLYPEGVDACFDSPECLNALVGCTFDPTNNKCVTYNTDCCNNGATRRMRRAAAPVLERSERRYRIKEGPSPGEVIKEYY